MKPFGLKEALSRIDEIPDSGAKRTAFLKALSLVAHENCRGKIHTLPSVARIEPEWLGVWYTPGVSAVSTAIRGDRSKSFTLTSRGSTVAVVTDSTRVLGDGDCTPPGGMGVMEGKALLMSWLGGLNAVPLCVDTRDAGGASDPAKLVDFVLAASPSFGAVNLEDISQPNCYTVLEELKRRCGIPVWHDDAQGTACVILAGLMNALELAGKRLEGVRIVFLGAGASCSASARLLIASGVEPGQIVLNDSKGCLSRSRGDYMGEGFSWHRELCGITNSEQFQTFGDSVRGADVLIAASAPGLVEREHVRSMAEKAIVFACANPVPEIYPEAALEAGAVVVATGRSDLPNQVNNCLGFPGILKGVLLSGAASISDGMAIAAARAIARAGRSGDFSPGNIMPGVDEPGVHAAVAAAVAGQAVAEGLAPSLADPQDVFRRAIEDIGLVRRSHEALLEAGLLGDLSDGEVMRVFQKVMGKG
jgi:malate dehydrogenase (oxaloacetate-decarboxylating)